MDEPAFPSDGKWGNGIPEKGMTLRDYFAAKAMSHFNWYLNLTRLKEEDLKTAKRCYAVADAMLKARGKAEGTEGK